MKKLMMIAVILGGFISAQAQEKIEKDTYILKGDVIEATLYHDNGVVSQSGTFTKEGKLTGTWTSYNRQGEKTAVGNYENNQKVGKWFFWTAEMLREVDYEDSKIAIVNTWVNEDTKVVSNK